MEEIRKNSKPHLIILRGNSGSGKSTAAKALRDAMRDKYGKGTTMLVSQDVIRIDMMDLKDTAGNDAITMIYDICMFGLEHGKNVILEGILDRGKYGEMLQALIKEWEKNIHIYYYDIPLEVTLERHDMRPQKNEFSKDAMREWYKADNRLNLPDEQVFDETVSIEQAVERILRDCNNNA